MQHRDKTILNKILNEIKVALDMVSSDFEAFNENEMMKRAICMTVINIGELVKALSDDIRTEYKHIPWRSIAGFRDMAAHKYQTLRMIDVHHTVINDFPKLMADIKEIL